MKKVISFGTRHLILERSKTIASARLSPISLYPFPSEIAALADVLNEADFIDIHTILIPPGKICFLVDRDTRNGELLDVFCDAITRVFDTDTVISDARSETIV